MVSPFSRQVTRSSDRHARLVERGIGLGDDVVAFFDRRQVLDLSVTLPSSTTLR
jgi:hypothetical protein